MKNTFSTVRCAKVKGNVSTRSCNKLKSTVRCSKMNCTVSSTETIEYYLKYATRVLSAKKTETCVRRYHNYAPFIKFKISFGVQF